MTKHVHKLERKGQSRTLFAFRSLVITSAIFGETRGKIIRGGFQSINAQAQQERPELNWRVSSNRTSVTTANGEVQTNEEATVYVHDLVLFVTVQIFEDTLAVPQS